MAYPSAYLVPGAPWVIRNAWPKRLAEARIVVMSTNRVTGRRPGRVTWRNRSQAVAGFDGIEDGRFSVPTLTTVAPDKEQIARLAVELLAELIGGHRGAVAREVSAGYRLELRESA